MPGETPTFEWEPVEGAAAYSLVVLDAEGQPVWAWEGPAPSAGFPTGPREPRARCSTPGSTWSVAALDGDGHVVAASELRPASP